MHNKKTNFNKWQKTTIIALIGFGLFNPFAVEVLDRWFKLAYTIFFVVCATWLMGFILFKSLKPDRINIPTKSKKTKAQNYITT